MMRTKQELLEQRAYDLLRGEPTLVSIEELRVLEIKVLNRSDKTVNPTSYCILCDPREYWCNLHPDTTSNEWYRWDINCFKKHGYWTLLTFEAAAPDYDAY